MVATLALLYRDTAGDLVEKSRQGAGSDDTNGVTIQSLLFDRLLDCGVTYYTRENYGGNSGPTRSEFFLEEAEDLFRHFWLHAFPRDGAKSDIEDIAQSKEDAELLARVRKTFDEDEDRRGMVGVVERVFFPESAESEEVSGAPASGTTSPPPSSSRRRESPRADLAGQDDLPILPTKSHLTADQWNSILMATTNIRSWVFAERTVMAVEGWVAGSPSKKTFILIMGLKHVHEVAGRLWKVYENNEEQTSLSSKEAVSVSEDEKSKSEKALLHETEKSPALCGAQDFLVMVQGAQIAGWLAFLSHHVDLYKRKHLSFPNLRYFRYANRAYEAAVRWLFG